MKDLYGVGYAMEVGYRILNKELDGICSCINCRRDKDDSCPAADKPRGDNKTCNYFKINLGDK